METLEFVKAAKSTDGEFISECQLATAKLSFGPTLDGNLLRTLARRLSEGFTDARHHIFIAWYKNARRH